jgi:hypothetical protein
MEATSSTVPDSTNPPSGATNIPTAELYPQPSAHPENPEETSSFPQQMVNDIRIRQPTATDITRYRLHHGVNLGGIFCLERWLFPSMFAGNAKGNSELAAVTAYVEANGIEKARGRWEQVWNPRVMQNAGCDEKIEEKLQEM